MTYETIDWDAEAQRIARAFGLPFGRSGEQPFDLTFDAVQNIRVAYLKSREWTMKNGRTLEVQISSTGAYVFTVNWPSAVFGWIEISLMGNGTIHYDEAESDFVYPLAKALFHLGMLTPAVEAAMKVSISEHEKLEWTLEYEQRTNFHTFDWDAEALRIAKAFDLEAKVLFIGDDIARDLSLLEGEHPNMIPCGAEQYLSVYRSETCIQFVLCDDVGIGEINIDYNGTVDGWTTYRSEEIALLTRGLFRLGLLKPAVEAALEVSITPHQKLEWTLEDEARNDL